MYTLLLTGTFLRNVTGISAGVLNPVVIIAYNNNLMADDGFSRGGSAAPFAFSPRCHDDDTQFRQVQRMASPCEIKWITSAVLWIECVNRIGTGGYCPA
jgi:hypothetical protein